MKLIFPGNYVVWDLETTGLDPKTERAVELAFMVVEGDKIVEEYSTLIDNQMDIPKEAADIHGITREMCEAEGVSPDEAWEKLIAVISKYKCNMTHNGTRFDHLFLAEQMKRMDKYKDQAAELHLLFQKYHVDTAALYKSMKGEIFRGFHESIYEFNKRVLEMRIPGLRFSLAIIQDEMEIIPDGDAHRALTDVKMTHEVFESLI